jgi:hypothetical protein
VLKLYGVKDPSEMLRLQRFRKGLGRCFTGLRGRNGAGSVTRD